MSVKDNSYGIAPLQNEMLNILKYFISLCEVYGLRYCACGGTCIGALRHQGFIPWDDDLDVFMPRPDYEKLWEICSKDQQNSKYKLCRTTADKNYHHRVMQMVDIETTFINKRSQNEDIEHGVYIDIIPLDVCPKSKFKRIAQIIDSVIFSVYNIQCLPEYHGSKVQIFVTKFLLAVVRNKKRRSEIWQKREKKMIKADWGDTDRLVELTTSFKTLLRSYPLDWFKFDGRKEKFEDIEIAVPSNVEEYLKFFFGDYMRLPPEEKRRVQHNAVYVDLENSYRVYKGKYYCCNI